jgi:hypothetical protein
VERVSGARPIHSHLASYSGSLRRLVCLSLIRHGSRMRDTRRDGAMLRKKSRCQCSVEDG